MNQQAIDWLLTQKPGTPPTAPKQHVTATPDNLFADIPKVGEKSQKPQTAANELPVRQDLFADIPVTPQAVEQEPSLWGQIKAGAADVASSYYMEKARQAAEDYQQLQEAKGRGLLGSTAPGLHGVSFGGVAPEDREQALKEREQDIAGYLKKSQEYQTYSQNMPMPESVRNFLDNTRDTSWFEDLKEAPVEIAANVTAKSLPASILSLGGNIGGALVGGLPGAIAGGTAVSGRMEYANSIREGLGELGIDMNDTQAFITAINNDEIMEPIREKALKRGVAIGFMDGVAALLGGKVLAPKAIVAKSAAKAQAINVPTQIVGQAGLGAGGEAAGQYWSEGEITDARAIAAEAVGEMTFAPVEAGSTLLAVTRGSKGIAEDRLKATNELLNVLNRKRQKAYKSGDPAAIRQANNEFNEYLNIRQELEQQLNMTDTESLIQSEKALNRAIKVKQRKYNQATAEERPALEKELTELNKRRYVIFDAIHSQGRTISTTPGQMTQAQALEKVKAERLARHERRRAAEEEEYQRRMNPLYAADEESRRIAAEGGDALEQQLAASNAYGSARSSIEIEEDLSARESSRQTEEAEYEQELLQRQENFSLTTPENANQIVDDAIRLGLDIDEAQIRQLANWGAVPKRLVTEIGAIQGAYSDQQQAIKAKAWEQHESEQTQHQEDIWAQYEASQLQQSRTQAETTEQQVSGWENRQGITEAETLANRRQQQRKEKLHNRLVEALQQQHQQSVQQAHQIIDEAVELKLIKNEKFARQVANQGDVPADLKQQIADLKAEEQAEPETTAPTTADEKRTAAHRIIDEAIELGILEHDVYARQLADIGQLPANLEQQVRTKRRMEGQTKQEEQREAFIKDQKHRQSIISLEQHLAEQAKSRDYEAMIKQADDSLNTMVEAEIAEWEESLGIPQEEAIEASSIQRKIHNLATQAQSRLSPEQVLAERIAYAHKVVDAAIANKEIGLMGEPVARQYANRGEIAPNISGADQRLQSLVDNLERHIADWTVQQQREQSRKIAKLENKLSENQKERDYTAAIQQALENELNTLKSELEQWAQYIGLSDEKDIAAESQKAYEIESQIQRLQQALEQKKQQVAEALANWSAVEQPAGAMQEQGATKYTPVERVTQEPAANDNERIESLNNDQQVTPATTQPWETDRDTWVNQEIQNSEYASKYQNDQEAYETVARGLQDDWKNSVIEQGNYGRLPDTVLDSFVEHYGRPALINSFRGTKEKAIHGYNPNKGKPANTNPVTSMKEFWNRVGNDFVIEYNDEILGGINVFLPDQDYYISFDGDTGRETGKVVATRGNNIKVQFPDGTTENVFSYQSRSIANIEQFEQFGRKQKILNIQKKRKQEQLEAEKKKAEQEEQDRINRAAKEESLIEQYVRHQSIDLKKTKISSHKAYDEYGSVNKLKIGNDVIYVDPKGHHDSLWTTVIQIQANDKIRNRGAFTREYATFTEAKENMLNDYKEAIVEEMERVPHHYEINADEQFEAQLKQIGKEWIKDKQHRFYFNDIIKELSGTNQQPPANAKLWYDKRTGFYGSDNLDDAVYDSAVERLELLRQSIIEEHGKEVLEPTALGTPEPTEPAPKAKNKPPITETAPQAPTTRPADFGKNNKIFTEDKVKAARERIKSKLSQFNSGFDPEMAADMFAIGGYYIEGGYRKFKDFSAGMVEEFGEAVKPYLKSAYESVRMFPDLAEQVKEMDSHDFVANTDIDKLLAPEATEQLAIRNENMEALNNVKEKTNGPRGFTNKSGTATFNKMDDTTESIDYNRIADIDQVSGLPQVTAKFFLELKEGDLLVNKSRASKGLGEQIYGVVSHTKGGKVHFKNESEPYAINFLVHKDDRKELGNEIRRLKAKQKGKPAPKTATPTTETQPAKTGQQPTALKQPATTTPKEQPSSTEQQNEHLPNVKFNTPLEFGKYKGKTINEIGQDDRSYLRWLADTKLKRDVLISDHAGEWLDTNGLWSTDELTEAATLARENILNNEDILSGKETSAEITRKMGKKDQVITITPYPNHLQIETTTYTTKYGGGRSKQTTEQTRRNEYTYKALLDVLTDQEVSQLKKLETSGRVEPPSTTGTTTHEGTGTTGQGTLEGVSPGEVQTTEGGRNTGEGSPDHTGESGGYDHGTNGRSSGDELGGSQAPSLPNIDIHGAGTVSQGEVGTGGTDRAGGINSDSVDYSITAQDEIEQASFNDSQKYQSNIEAIKLLKELGQRPATLEQKKVLAKYVGWGGLKQAFYREDGTTRKGWEDQAAELKALLTPEEYEAARASTLNAHYTSWDVVHPIYTGLRKLGFTGGRMLEPSLGVGNFYGMMPTDMRRKSRLVGVELDNITGGIAKKLYGNSARIHAPRGFETFDLADGTYDIVVGNPPFGDETITDAKRKDISGLRIHNYFFAKGMKALRPGGVMAMVVSKGFMDSSENQKGREMMFREARLLGAFRLPNQAFKANANTDVTTDIIFLQKREAPLEEGQIEGINDYRNRADFVGADGNTMKINQYFVENPDYLLGDMIMNTGRFGPELEPALTTRKGLDWKKALAEGVEQLAGRYDPEANIELSSANGTPDASTDIQRADIDGLYINDQGQLSKRLPDLEGATQGTPVTTYTNNQGKTVELRPAQIKKLSDAVKLARTVRHLINMQVTDMTDPQLEPLRQQLNRKYDAFVKKYHMINRPLFKSLLNQTDLTIAPMLFALENSYKKEKKVNGETIKESSTKADIFTRRTQEPFTQVTKVSSAEEALIVALMQTGKVDLDKMSELSGISRTDLASQLTDIIYDDPVAGWVTKDEYLSGNVKRKLRQAKEMGRGYEDNVKALEAVQPVDIPATEIITTLGAHWQTPEVINQFWAHLGGMNAESAFVPERSTWVFRGSEQKEMHKWRTEEKTMKDLVTSLLNNKAIAVYQTEPVTGKRSLDVRATDAAIAKANDIQHEFLAWLWRDSQRREAMVRRYNDMVNTDVNRQYDGSFLTFPGKISDDIIKLRKTQANAIWRIIQSPTTLLDHVVGAGKTFTMIAAAMELKRTGLAKKPLIVVPNHLVAQWAEDFARLYPNAKILAASKQDFSAKRRKEMLARIATGNWDAVIIAHSSFGKMPTDPETEQNFIQEQIQDLTIAITVLREAEGKSSRSVREAENSRKKLREKLKELIENTDKDVGMTWNETGVDALFVDEAHEYKNLQFFTAMNRVKNINPSGSKKAQDLFIKIRALLTKTGGRNLVFATGTPVSNSMAELYTMQRYLSYQQLVESSTNHFDAWARTFGTTVTNQERTSSGKYGPVSRFSEFINLPELITKYRGFADTINNEDIRKALAEEGKGIHIPTVKGGKPQAVVAPRSIYQEAYMGMIEHRFENMPDDPREDNPLKATNDARKAGLDMRMIYPELPDDPGSKINLSINNMMRLYNQWRDDKGTQLVFCDLSTPKSQQAKEIKDFRTMVEEAAKDDGNRQNTKDMSVQELYDYLQAMADNGNNKAISRLEKVNQDDIEGWTSKFDVYNDVKTKLMDQGVPESEIAFIHNANTDAQKQDLFDKVNRGEIRFLLGSTAKMGAGTNVQERLVGLHHLDAPWRPSDLEQREGRIIRQGNKLFLRDPEGFEVEILRYATEQTYDVNMWQMLEVKALFIQQLRNGSLTDRTAKDVGGEAASAAEMKAASSGDPRVMEQVAILARLKILNNLRETNRKDRTRATIRAESLEQEKRDLPARINSYRQDYEQREPLLKAGPGLKTPDGHIFDKSGKAADWFKQEILTRLYLPESDAFSYDGEIIGSFRGYEVRATLSSKKLWNDQIEDRLRLDLVGKNRDYYIFSLPVEEVKWNGIFDRFNNAIENIDKNAKSRQNKLDNIDAEIDEQEQLARTPFKEEAEYQRKMERNLELMEELGSEDKVNEQAKLQAEYQLLNNLAEEYYHLESDNITEILSNTALGNRANRLARSILYSKEGTEKTKAKEAIEEAKKQGLTITDKAIKAEQKRIDEAEAEAQRKLEEKQIKQNAENSPQGTTTGTTETTTEEITFTSADEAIKHALDNKQTITADNGNIQLERSSLGNWQLSVAWQDKAYFDNDSIVMDTDLSLLTGGRGFTSVGEKMVMTFKEDRLTSVIRRLYGKMSLQGIKTQKTQAEPIRAMYSKVAAEEVVNGIPLKQGQRIAEKVSSKLNLSRSERLIVDIMKSPEDLIQEFTDKGIELTDDDKKDIRESKALFMPRMDRATGKIGLWRVVGFTDMAQSASDFRASLRHEIIGHFGMDTLHPDDKAAIFEKIENSRNNRHIQPIYDAALKNYGKYGKDVVLDEIIAGLAETKTGYPRMLWTRIKSLVIKGLRRVGLITSEITKTELQDLVRVLRARVKNAETPLFTSSIIPETMAVNERPPDIGRIRYRQSDNSADVSIANNSNNSTDNANRLFSTLALAENELIKNALKVTGRKASSGMVQLRKLMLPSMGLRQIVDTYETVFDPMAADIDLATNTSKGNPIQKYQRYVQGMQSLKANKLAEADNVDIQWGQLAKANPTEYNKLADMMHEATVYEVFPEKDYFIEHENMRELRRDYAKEQDPVKQEVLRKRIMFERERLSVYNKLSAQYQNMSQQAKDVYQAVEGFHKQMWEDHQKALEDKIKRSMQNSNEAQAFIKQLKAQFHEAKIRGPYFPLQRFGSFYLIAEDEQGVYYREHYETEAQLYKHKEEIEKAGMNVLSFGLMPDFTSRKLEGVSGFADQIHIALESDKFANVSAAIKDEIRSEINQLALQLLPDVSAAKNMIRRRKVKGYSDNARRAFAFSAIHQSNRLARTIYGDQMTTELERIHDDIDSHNENPLIAMEQRTVAAQVLGELEKQHEKIMNPSGSPIAAKITNLAFIWYLGASAGAGFINMSQTALIGIPLMGGRFGYRKTTAAVARAAKDFGLHGYNKISLRESMFTLSKATKGVTADEKRMLEQLIDDGTIDTTQTSTLAQIADSDLRADAQVNQDRWVKLNRLLGYFFHNAEVANREITALATYRMAREEGQTHENAVEIARKLTFDSHFDYSGANRPRVMKSDWMKVFTIFKQYSQNMTYTLVRNFVKSRPFSKFSAKEKKQARKALAGILFAHATAAGTLGLPMVSIIGPILAETFKDDDDEFRNWKTMYRNWLADLVGKDMGHAIAKGVFNGFMGSDIHARVKIDDLWIQEPNWEMSAREESMHYLLQGLGPAASAVINFFWLGPEQIAQGDTWKGIEKMVPKFIRDGLRTYRYATEGATVGRGGYQAMIEEFTPGELAKQFLGVSPARLSEGYEARSAVKNMEQKLAGRRGELMQGYTRAYMKGDYEKAEALLAEIQQFNIRNPLYGITGDALRQSLRMKYRYKELSQSGIYLPETKKGLLSEARFAL